MSILAVKQDVFQKDEIKEMAKSINSDVYFANTIFEAVKYIENNKTDIVLINLLSLKDIGFIKYINDNHKSVSVYISSEKYLEEAISIARTGEYTILNNPLDLRTLQNK